MGDGLRLIIHQNAAIKNLGSVWSRSAGSQPDTSKGTVLSLMCFLATGLALSGRFDRRAIYEK